MDDNERDYGKRFFTMTFKEAIEAGAICDYQILTMVVTDREIKALIAKNRLLTLSRKLTEAEARDLATAIALKRTSEKKTKQFRPYEIPADCIDNTPTGDEPGEKLVIIGAKDLTPRERELLEQRLKAYPDLSVAQAFEMLKAFGA
jgi:hypothetical protein